MLRPVTNRNEHLDRLPKQLGSEIAKQFFRLRIDEDNLARPVNDQNGVRRRFEQAPELLLSLLANGGVADGAHDHGALFGFERAEADLDGKLRSVHAAAEKLHSLT